MTKLEKTSHQKISENGYNILGAIKAINESQNPFSISIAVQKKQPDASGIRTHLQEKSQLSSNTSEELSILKNLGLIETTDRKTNFMSKNTGYGALYSLTAKGEKALIDRPSKSQQNQVTTKAQPRPPIQTPN